VTEPLDDAQDRLTRRVLWSLPTGLYLIGSAALDRRNLMTANWVLQVATAPRVVAVSVEATSLTRELIEGGGGFTVSLLHRADRALIRRFVKPVAASACTEDAEGMAMAEVPVILGMGGRPRVVQAAAWLECDLVRTVDFESHVVCFGAVTDAGEATPGAELLRMEDTRMNYGG